MAVNIHVSPLGTPAQAQPGLSQLQRILNASYTPPEIVGDPRARVSVPSPQEAPELIVPEGAEYPDISNPAQAAALNQAPYPPTALMQPAIDPETGGPVPSLQEQIPWNEQVQQEAAPINAVPDFMAALPQEDGTNWEGRMANVQGLLDTVEGHRITSPQSSPALASRTDETVSAEPSNSYAQRVTPTLDSIMETTQRRLYSMDKASMKTRLYDDASGQTHNVPMGLLVLDRKNLLSDPQAKSQVAAIVGMAGMRAVAQMGQKREEDTPHEGEGSDSEGINNFISSMLHHASVGAKNAGLPLDRADLFDLVKTQAMSMIAEGDVGTFETARGNQVVAMPELKAQAREFERLASIIFDDGSRGRMGLSPMPSGRGLLSNNKGWTARSIAGRVADKLMRAAELTKSLLGSVGMIFPQKNLERKNLEIQLVMDPEMLETNSAGVPIYSTHMFAERMGLHKKAYDTARGNVRPPPWLEDRSDPKQMQAFEAYKDQKAAEVMELKFKEIERYMEAATTSSGRVRYNRFIHALNNFRFYTNTFDGDYQGSKNVIRDIISFAKRSTAIPSSFFDRKEVEKLTSLAKDLWGGNSSSTAWGVNLLERLKALPASTRGALGAMQNAVVYYYTAVEPDALGEGIDVTKMSPGQIISLYEPKIGEALASLGEEYNNFLQNPKPGNDNGSLMLKLWASTEKGAAQSSLNLWDDFFNASKAYQAGLAGRQHPIQLTHHSISDGNQSGIFLQAAIYGLEGNAPPTVTTMLSQATPTLQDLRVNGWGTIIRELRDIASKDEGDGSLAGDWLSFFEDLHKQFGIAAVAKDFFKLPLMQAAYGKNAYMFESELYDVLSSSKYADTFDKYLGQHGNPAELNKQLQQAVGKTLTKIVNARGNKNLMNIGQFFGIMNAAPQIAGVSGDFLTITPVENTPVAGDPKRLRASTTGRTADGRPIRLRVRGSGEFETGAPMVDAKTGDPIEVARHELQMNPSAKRVKTFLSRVTGLIEPVEDPYGYGLRRQLPVLLVQALDGDLVKWTTLKVNEDTGAMGPRPVMWVHDSGISTPDAGLIYNHTYNNVAIPALMENLQTLLPRLWRHKKAVQQTLIQRIRDRGEDVGIGPAGEFPALGAVFKDLYDKINSESYKARWFSNDRKKSANPNAKTDLARWNENVARTKGILKEAEKAGWVYPDGESLTLDQWQDLAVTPGQFIKLLELAEKALNLHESTADSHIPTWIARSKDRVKRIFEQTMLANKHGGFVHMRVSEAAPASPKTPNPPERPLAEVQREKERDRAMKAALNATLDEFDDRPKTNDVKTTPTSEGGSTEERVRSALVKRKTDQIKNHLAAIKLIPNPRDPRFDTLITEILKDHPDKWNDEKAEWENGISRTAVVEEIKKRTGKKRPSADIPTFDDLDFGDDLEF